MKVPAITVALVLASAAAPRAQTAGPVHDTFNFIGEIHKASIVMLAETGLVARPLAGRLAKGIRTAIDSQAAPGSPRPTDDFDWRAAAADRRAAAACVRSHVHRAC